MLPMGFNLYVRGVYHHHRRIGKSVYVKLNDGRLINLTM